jgi:ribose transport system substrate-binding protein
MTNSSATARLAAAITFVAASATVPAYASQDKPVIALSNAYYGNTWRHQMVEAFEAAAKQAKADGKIADYMVLNGDGSVNQQSSQMADLIL